MATNKVIYSQPRKVNIINIDTNYAHTNKFPTITPSPSELFILSFKLTGIEKVGGAYLYLVAWTPLYGPR